MLDMLSKPVLLALGLPLLFGLVKTQDNRPPLVFNCADIAGMCGSAVDFGD